ncbi:MAG: SAM-dependent chlorinase/fluorinase, partial [Acidobacteriota bacterium]
VASHDLLEGAFTLLCSYSCFPPRTIHLVVVDPGVGSERKSILVVTENYYFIGPDNGVLSLVYEKEKVSRVISIEAEHHFRQPVSPTFHGRDIFGPVAGNLARGIQPEKFGPEIEEFTRLALPTPQKVSAGHLEGIVLHVDKFGNLITNLSPPAAARLMGRQVSPAEFQLGDRKVSRHVEYYSQASPGELISLVGSSGFYEIAALKEPAARLLNARRGTKVRMMV